MTVRSITGNIADFAGVASPNKAFDLIPAQFGFGDATDTVVLGDVRTIVSDGAGDVAFDAEEGVYALRFQTTQGQKSIGMTVDSDGPWTIGRLVQLADPVITNAIVQAAEAAQQAAETAEANASASAAAAATSETNAATSASEAVAASDEIATTMQSSRPDLVTLVAGGQTWPDGTRVSDGTVMYIASSGATSIADLPGLLPFGVVYPDHFTANTTPGTTDMAGAIEATWAYDQSFEFLPEVYASSRAIDLISARTDDGFGSPGFAIRGAGRRETVISFTDASDAGLTITNRRVSFDGATDVDAGADTISITAHGFETGDTVVYNDGGGTAPTGLTSTTTTLYVIKVDADTLALATSSANASSDTRIDITAVGSGSAHMLYATQLIQGTLSDFSIYCTEQTSGHGIKLSRHYNSNISNIEVDGFYDAWIIEGCGQLKFANILTRAVKRSTAGRRVWSCIPLVAVGGRTYGPEWTACENHGGQDYNSAFYFTSLDGGTINGGHYNHCIHSVHINTDGTSYKDFCTSLKVTGTYFDADITGTKLQHIYIECPDGGSGDNSIVDGFQFTGAFFRGGTGVLKLDETAGGVAGLSKFQDFKFVGCEIQDVNGRCFDVENTNLTDPADQIRQISIVGNSYSDGGILGEFDPDGSGSSKNAFAWLAGSGHILTGNTIEGGWDDGGEQIIVPRSNAEDCIIDGNTLRSHRTSGHIAISGTDNVIGINNWNGSGGIGQIGSGVSIAGTSGVGLELKSRVAGTTSDMVLRGNAIIGGENSIIQSVGVGGRFEWWTGNTDPAAGTSTGAEIAQIDDTRFNTTVPHRVVPVAVASLPAPATAGVGARHFVTDATATTFASVVTGGGTDAVPVYSDGTDWRIG